MRTLGFVLTLVASVLGSTAALGGDGRIEINQSGVVGFPIVISQSGSYVLTGNLFVPNFVTAAIRVDVDNVAIDLNGFKLDGPVTCTTLGCNVPGGIGIDATGRRGILVRDGVIRQFGGGGIAADNAIIRNVSVHETGGNGIHAGYSGRVENCQVTLTVGDGVRTFEDSVITGNTVHEAGQNGIRAGQGSVVRDNVVRSSVAAGLLTEGDVVYANNALLGNSPDVETTIPTLGWARATAGNYCSDKSCYRIPMRRYYLTPEKLYTGQFASGACADGFHMASLWEIRDTAAIRYDTSRGYTQQDTGEGPPSEAGLAPGTYGWVRTGANASLPSAGRANCDGWKSSSEAEQGTVAGLQMGWDPFDISGSTPGVVSPWIGFAYTCDTQFRVWCVED